MATPKQKAQAGLDAFTRLKVAQPNVATELGKVWSAAQLKFTPAVQGVLGKITNAATRKALTDWFSDPAAVKVYTDDIAKAVGGVTKGVGDSLGTTTGVVAGIPAQVADAAATGLGNTFDSGVLGFLAALTSANTWLRIAEVVLGVTLVVVGLVKLMPDSVKSNVKTVAKVASVL